MAEDKKLNALIKKARNAEKEVKDYRNARASTSWKHLVRAYRPIRVDKNGNTMTVPKHPDAYKKGSDRTRVVAHHTLKDFKDFKAHYLVLDRHSADYRNYLSYRQALAQQSADNQANIDDNSDYSN